VTETLAGAQALSSGSSCARGDCVSTGQRLAIPNNDVAEARAAQADAGLSIVVVKLPDMHRRGSRG
jgi:hypothetical protein